MKTILDFTEAVYDLVLPAAWNQGCFVDLIPHCLNNFDGRQRKQIHDLRRAFASIGINNTKNASNEQLRTD